MVTQTESDVIAAIAPTHTMEDAIKAVENMLPKEIYFRLLDRAVLIDSLVAGIDDKIDDAKHTCDKCDEYSSISVYPLCWSCAAEANQCDEEHCGDECGENRTALQNISDALKYGHY